MGQKIEQDLQRFRKLVRGKVKERRSSALIITHDLGIVARMADRVSVMYAGEGVESAAATALFNCSSSGAARCVRRRETTAPGRRGWY